MVAFRPSHPRRLPAQRLTLQQDPIHMQFENMLRIATLARVLLLLLCPEIASVAFTAATTVSAAELDVQFNRDVRPILADKCYRCHGPDEATREADLRLDQSQAATEERGGYRVIAPGKPDSSALIHRITATDVEQRMPPIDSGSTLDPLEIDILRKWIQDGATYESHWSFVPPKRPRPPQVDDHGWSRNAIDQFVIDRLQLEGLEPSEEAAATTLVRRVTLALTGLPPTLEEVEAFERAAARDLDTAYSLLVERLLASPRFGENMALGWLDAARYADTNGYFTDNERTMWPWRDWVINAFNENMPFDQFTIEQLAGDLLDKETAENAKGGDSIAAKEALNAEDRSLNRLIATGFNRNHMVNNETGIIEEEFRVEYVVDRVDTTATVWMGLTLGCARCHDHKYDPISQREFYQFFSFFNNVPERGLSGSGGNAEPVLKVPSAQQLLEAARLRREVEDAERVFADIGEQLDIAQAKWEMTAIERSPQPSESGLTSHYPLDDALPSDSTTGPVKIVPGMIGKAAQFGGDASIQFADQGDFERNDAFSFGAWVLPKGSGCIISKTDDADDMRGYDVTLRKGKAIVNLVNQWNRNAIKVSTVASVASGQWRHLMVTYDGSSQASGVRVYLDGLLQQVTVDFDKLTSSIRNREPLRIGRRQASASFSGLVDDVRVYSRELTDEEVSNIAAGQLIRSIVTQPLDKRSDFQQRQLRSWFIAHHADQRLATAAEQLDRLRDRERLLLKSFPTTMVMQESDTSRSTFLLLRGQYDQPGDKVTAGVPDFLANRSLQATAGARPANRLDLARWLVNPAHPLTARVAANRLWQSLFGSGIVKTVDDFGTQGDWPSHPGLLDWLALELIESDWDVKRLLRLIVTSATYRQSARCDPALIRHDRENRLLARGPRFRMNAETLRDNALSIAGLLSHRIGGPSVKPYQPAGLWEDVTYDSDSAFQQTGGDSLYRRSLYTFWKRQSPPPNMLVFDAPTRETCTTARSRTNTPLQALVLMNDPTFVEASRKLAERAMSIPADTASTRIEFVFRSATARRPTSGESNILLDLFREQLQEYKRDQSIAADLLTVGESKYDPTLDPVELAAWTTVVSMILSLDETITRP